MNATQALLAAIKRFEAEHGEDEKFRDVFTSLTEVEGQMEKAAPPAGPSPGQQAARKAAEFAKARADRRPEQVREDAKGSDEPPRSMAEARASAKRRLEARTAKPESSESGDSGDAGEAQAAPAAA